MRDFLAEYFLRFFFLNVDLAAATFAGRFEAGGVALVVTVRGWEGLSLAAGTGLLVASAFAGTGGVGAGAGGVVGVADVTGVAGTADAAGGCGAFGTVSGFGAGTTGVAVPLALGGSVP